MKTSEAAIPSTPSKPHAEVDATELPARERWRRAFSALATVLKDPDRTDQVLVFSTYANAGTMKTRIHRFLDDPRGRRLFEERRTIDGHSIDLDALGRLPVGTLGRAYADFLGSRGLTPDVFENPPENVRDPELAYVIMRLRQTHDLWHVVTGYNTDPASEVALQAFTYGQLRAPSSGILALLGTLKGLQLKPTLAVDVGRGYRMGKRALHLPVFPWEDHWATPLAEVRAMLNLPIVPTAAERLGREVAAALAAMPAETPTTGWGTPIASTNDNTSSPNPETAWTLATSSTAATAGTVAQHGAALLVTGGHGSAANDRRHRRELRREVRRARARDLAERFKTAVNESGPARARRARRTVRRAMRAARAA